MIRPRCAFPFAAIGLPLLAALFVADGVAAELNSGDLVVAHPAANELVRLDPSFASSAMVGGGAVLDTPSAIAFTGSGSVLVACRGVDTVAELDADGLLLRTLGAAAALDEITGVAAAPRGHILITARSQDRVVELDANGDFVRDYGASDGLDEPRGVRVGRDGHVYVASFLTDRVLEFSARGEFVREIGVGTPLDGPDSIVFDATGRMFVTSSNTGTVLVFDAQGDFDQEFGAVAAMATPTGIAIRADGGIAVGDAGGELHLFDASFAHEQTMDDVVTAFGGLAFAPLRYKVSLKGDVSQGGVTTSVSENGELAFDPGSAWFGLFLTKDGSPIADALGSELFAAPGRLIGGSATSKKRGAHGVEWTPRAAEDGVLSIDIAWKGKVKDGRYVPSNGSGTLHGSGEAFALSVAVKIKKTLD